MEKQISLISKLSYDKININWNKNPVDMKLFLSFLTINVIKSTDHLGYCNGWTLYKNDEHRLLIGGGIVGNNEYLDSIQFGEMLHNKYNNYINPFYLFDIFNNQGKLFFINYYNDDIVQLIEKQKKEINLLEDRLSTEKERLQSLISEHEILKHT